ncbi:hypothetical protein amrb99_51350 [Actinomadura sp. RB99]|uniref:hypothetical protein n=1 Tax=Actinomadura sp. RB99 TaxID=2691577 RepID=UPI001689C385|nr:hypothetical protein [Actinomadura sp. RB99]MBD2896191.1 hypothetical protein [Actinomadura sp. RB99]
MGTLSPASGEALNRYEGISVAVIRMTDEMREHLVRHRTFIKRPTFTIADTAGLTWKRDRRYLGVFKTDVDGEVKVVGLGVMTPSKMASNFTRKVRVEQFDTLEHPIPASRIRDMLGNRYQDALNDGPPTDARARRLLAVLEGLSESVGVLISGFAAGLTVPALGDAAAEVRSFEKDATATLLEAVLGDRGAVRDAGLLHESEPFVEAMPGDRNVNYDWLHFADWPGFGDVSTGIRRFVGPHDQELVVCNLTKRLPEQVDGVDLLYYNELHSCFVLVQYKRLFREGRHLSYPGDHGLDQQLARLRAIDDACPPGDAVADIRLHAQPTFFKFCEPSPFDPGSIDMLKGVYLARPHFERIFAGGEGLPGGSRYRLGKGEVPRHLNTTAFTMLLAHGWIGSCGIGSDFVREQARLSLSTRGSLVFGLHRSERPLGNNSMSWS